MASLTPTFQLKFGHAILPQQVVAGRFDGRHPSLAAATTGGRVLLHTPHELDDGSAGHAGPGVRSVGSTASGPATQVRFLNINREVTALGSGVMAAGTGRDALLVGTGNSLQAYDVLENRDLFFRDVPDAVTAVTCGAWSHGGPPVAMAGGNCSIQGFDRDGKDAYWTVTGDVVTCMAMGDVRGEGKTELLIGSADFDVRCYKGEDLHGEATETDRPTALLVAAPGRFGYALANGTVGVYNGATFTRIWRMKTKSRVVALACFDIDADGTAELVAAYANGRWEARRVHNGELVYRDNMGTAIAGLVTTDYRGDGKPVLLIVSADGEVRGYSQSDADTLATIRAAAGAIAGTAALETTRGGPVSSPMTISTAAAAASAKGGFAPSAGGAGAGGGAVAADVLSLLAERAKLDAELRALEAANAGGVTKKTPAAATSLPAATDISISLDFSPAAHRLELAVRAGAATGLAPGAELSLRTVTVYALDAGIFGADRESCVVVSPATVSSSMAPSLVGVAHAASVAGGGGGAGGGSDGSILRVPLNPPSNTPTELRVQAVVGAHHSGTHFAVIEKSFRLPKFAMFQLVNHNPALLASLPAPRGTVKLHCKERASRVGTWISRSFPVRPEQIIVSTSSMPALDCRFVNLRTGGCLAVQVESEHGGAVVVGCDDVDLAGEIVQDIAAYMGLPDWESVADFPEEFAAFRRTLQRLEELTAVRNRLTGDSAVTSGLVKTLVVQAEDARVLVDMPRMRKHYGELRTLHGELLGDYAKRLANHTTLVATLKDVNQMIQRAANLRVGAPKSRVIAACRLAIKNNAPTAMLPVMATGKATGV